MSSIPPTVPPAKALRRLIPFARNPLRGLNRYIDEYGPSFFLRAGRARRSLITTDPAIVQHALQRGHRQYEKSEIQTDQMARYLGRGLLTNSGQDWLRQRRLIQPGFHREKLRELIDQMQAETERKISEIILPASQAGQKVEAHEFTTEITFSIIARAIFTDGFTPQQVTEFSEAVTTIQAYIIYPLRLPFMRPILRLLGFEKKYRRIAEEVGQQLLERVNERRASNSSKPDLLQMLLDSRYEDTGEPMDDERLIDEIMILFAAGHETSANALAWTLLLLADHPEVLAKCVAEIDSVMGRDAPNLENLHSLQYLQQVIEESMRLYPPAWVTDRIALEANEVDGIPLGKDDVIVPYIYGIHRSPLLYEQPDEFRPERMAPDQRKARHPFSYLPFGGGPRLCIGNHFAMLEMKIVLLNLLRDWDFRRSNTSPVPPKALITLRPDRDILLVFQCKS